MKLCRNYVEVIKVFPFQCQITSGNRKNTIKCCHTVKKKPSTLLVNNKLYKGITFLLGIKHYEIKCDSIS